ncbi:MAG: HEAT repeat domain-containing protein [Planctomycetes bacterium]|nr:HEAT repeat domain-containing protein [Planctomycetota bacterium]
MNRRSLTILLLGLLAGACAPGEEPLLVPHSPPPLGGPSSPGADAALPEEPDLPEGDTGFPRGEAARVVEASGAPGPEAVPALLELLDGKMAGNSLEDEVLRALVEIGPSASPALMKVPRRNPRLRKGRGTGRDERIAVEALMRIRPPAPGTIAFLFRRLGGSPWERPPQDPATLIAGRFGAAAVPELVEILDSGIGSDRLAASCLAEIGAPAVPVLLSMAASDPPPGRGLLRALLAVGPRPAWVPHFERGLADPDAAVRLDCETALIAVGKPAVPALRRVLEGSSEDARPHALTALALLGEDVAPAVEAMLLGWPEPTRLLLLSRTHRLGTDAAKLAPVMGRLLEDPSEAVAKAAWEALAGLGPAAVPALADALRVPSLRLRAAAELGRIGKDPRTAVPALAGLLADGDPGVRRAALEALGEFFEEAAPAVPWILPLLADANDPELRIEAARVLGRIGEQGFAAAPALEALAREGDFRTSAAAACALESVRSPSRPAGPR